MGTYGPQATSAPTGAIILHPGDNISALVSAAPTGATFYFEPGVYRGVSLAPKDGQTFIGAEGAILNGSAVLTNWTQSGNLWVIGGQTQQGPVNQSAEFLPGTQRPGNPETVFLDNTPLKPVDALSKVVPGTFYFDYAADKIYIADNPAGHTVEAGKLTDAFHGSATNVTIQNLVIEKYDPEIQDGAIRGDQSWTIRDNEVRLNYAVGITAHDGSQIIGNYVHDNGQMGLGGYGNNILVQGNELARNGFWSGIDPLWEAGGFKFADTDNLVVRGNYSHDNNGSGMWTDINNIHTLYENNLVVHNTINGISHEISYDAIIRNNTLIGNGYGDTRGWGWGAEINIQNSQNVQVYGNRVEMTGGGNGIVMIQQNRGSGTFGTYTTTGNQIHDNTIVDHDGHGSIGGFADYNQSGMLNGGNTWSNNQYFMSDGGGRFQWSGSKTFAQFKAAAHETGSISQSYPDTSGWLTGGTSGGTVAPVVTEALVSDTGSSATDKITSNAALTGTADPNSVVTFTMDGVATSQTATTNASGAWTFTPSGLSDGQHTIVASETNGAGLIGSASLGFTLDKTAPTVGSIAASGSGITAGSGVLGVGKVVTLTVNMSEAVTVTGTPTLTLNGGDTATYTGGSGTTALTFSYTVANGRNTADLAVNSLNLGGGLIVDAAGNAANLAGAANYNPPGTLQISTTAAPVLTEALASDTGTSPVDKITSNPALTGTADANAVVHFTVDGAAIAATATANASGVWSYTPTLLDGQYTIVASETNSSGITGTASLSFTLDTHAPLPTITGESLGGRKGKVTLTGTTGEASDVISIYDGNIRLGTTTTGSGGAWTFTTGTVSNSVHTYTATATDSAGNTGAGSNEAVLGGTKADILVGTSGNDFIMGHGGNDKIAGGGGADTLTGGPGRVTFVYNAVTDSTPALSDTITDFRHSYDKFDFTNIAGINASGGIPQFQGNITGSGNLTLNPHSVAFVEVGGRTEVLANTSGAAETVTTTDFHAADMKIEMVGIHLGLTAADLLGQFMASSFTPAGSGQGVTPLAAPIANQSPLLAPPQHG